MSRIKRYPDVVGGGLVLEPNLKANFGALSVPDGFSVPAWVDGRPLCIPSSNQGAESSCAGFATAGKKEVDNWQQTGIQLQFDGSLCYREAKKIDGSPNSQGTSLTAALISAQSLGWFDPAKTIKTISTKLEVQWALHRQLACVGGFMITKEWQEVNMETGMIGTRDKTELGGHAVLICYYDEISVGWQNSWDEAWGVRGFGRMTWEQFDRQFMYAAILE